MFKKKKSFAARNLGTVTKTAVNPKIVTGVVILVILIGLSFIGSTLLMPATGTNSNTNDNSKTPPPPPEGICVYWSGVIGSHKEIHERITSCVNRSWWLFCADISPTEPATSCRCNTPGVLKSEMTMQYVNNRDTYIENFNDGLMDTNDIFAKMKTDVVAMLGCMCGIYSAGSAPADPSLASNTFPCPETRDHEPCKGTFDLAKKANILFSKMMTMPNCELFPSGCGINKTWGAWSPNHKTGKAIDFCCDGTSCNISKINELIGKIEGADKNNFSIVRECTAAERTCNGTSGCAGGMVHIDINHKTPIIQKDCISVNR